MRAPKDVTTADDVVAWFGADALSTANANVKSLVLWINTLRHRQQQLMVEDEEAKRRVVRDAYRKTRLIQVSLRNLRAHLPWLLEQNGWLVREEPELPEAARLRRLNDDLVALFAGDAAVSPLCHDMRGAYLFTPPSRGRPRPGWQLHADALIGPIERTWKLAGRDKLSYKAGGPVVRVMCRALAAIDGEEHKPATVASGLNVASGRKSKKDARVGPNRKDAQGRAI